MDNFINIIFINLKENQRRTKSLFIDLPILIFEKSDLYNSKFNFIFNNLTIKNGQ